MREIFLGPVRYWLLWVIIVAVLYWAGTTQLHTISFRTFLIVLGVLALGSVLTIVLTYRKGERITRDPLKDEE